MLMLPDYRVRQRDFLLEISRAMTAQLDLGEVLRLVLRASVLMLAGKVGLVALRGAEERFAVRAAFGVESARLEDLNARLHELMASASWRTDTAFLNVKLNQMAVLLDRSLRQSLFLPLMIGGELLGLIIIFRSYWVQTTENDEQILQSFADQAAIAVHNAQLYSRILYERKQLAAILDYSADGVMTLDPQLRIVGFNRAVERMTGWTAGDALGKDIDQVIVWAQLDKGDLQQAVIEGWPFRLQAGDSAETLYAEGEMQRRDGLTISLGITYAALLDDDGHLANIIANVRDITHFRRAQEMQNVFVSTVSHELKTPVAIIKGYAGTLRREDAAWDPQVVQQGLLVIEEESDRLTDLIENLLAAGKLRAEGMRLSIGDVDLRHMAQDVADRMQNQTALHHISVQFPDDFPLILGDVVRLRQVLDNLVGNAIKYSPNGGEITIGGDTDDRYVRVYVRDQGIGIPENELERIFDRFYRIDGAMSRKTNGAGLGLYLVRAIVETHGGSIRVKSKLGQGSTFYFTLPLEAQERNH